MVDSLVRVSRRVGGAADLLATEGASGVSTTRAIRAGPNSPRRGRGRKTPGAEGRAPNFTPGNRPAQAVRRVTTGGVQPGRGLNAGEGPCGSQHRRKTPAEPEPPAEPSRNASVYLCTVSRTLELSLQSSFQSSLTVLVCYRSRGRI